MFPWVWESVTEWISTLVSELPFLESDYIGQNPLHWKVPYIIEKLLERRCLKWVCMTHLDNEKTSYGQKKGRESNCQFHSRPLKVKNHPDFLVCRWCVTYHCKDLDEGYNYSLWLTSIGSLHTELWDSKIAHLGVLGQNDIWVLASWQST
jgi:hypothetical protein